MPGGRIRGRHRRTPIEEREPESGPVEWRIQVYERDGDGCPYARFERELNAYRRVVLDLAVRLILGRQGNNVCETEWGKNLGRGLYEFRIRRSVAAICSEAGIDPPSGVTADERILLRVFFAVEGARIILLLAGYDKGADPSRRRQDREIARARILLRKHQEDQKLKKKFRH